jgi:acyl-CoA synthetase (AMP-forming)/AMP-acid ligase II
VPKEVLQFTRKLFSNIEVRESYGATEIGGIYSNKTVPRSIPCWHSCVRAVSRRLTRGLVSSSS